MNKRTGGGGARGEVRFARYVERTCDPACFWQGVLRGFKGRVWHVAPIRSRNIRVNIKNQKNRSGPLKRGECEGFTENRSYPAEIGGTRVNRKKAETFEIYGDKIINNTVPSWKLLFTKSHLFFILKLIFYCSPITKFHVSKILIVPSQGKTIV